MTYRYDSSLEFLQYCSNNELNFFVELYTNEANLTESLTTHILYKQHTPNHKKYWKVIASELQHFGGNTFSNIQRGKGVLYKEILMDICKKEFITCDRNADVAQIEKVFVLSYLKKNIKNMTTSEIDAFKMNNVNKSLLKQGLNLFAGNALKKSFGLYMGVFSMIKDISDPAFRVTIPSILYISYLREQYKKEDLLFRQRFYPKVGAILRSDLMGSLIDHSGICLDENKIIEVVNENGTSIVKEVTYDEFVSGSSLRTGSAVYIAVDRLTKKIICSKEVALNALSHVGKKQKYELMKDNCHSFVYKCISNKDFEKKVEITLFSELTNSISQNLNNGKDIVWVVCDINPKEYKKSNNWKIEDEVE